MKESSAIIASLLITSSVLLFTPTAGQRHHEDSPFLPVAPPSQSFARISQPPQTKNLATTDPTTPHSSPSITSFRPGIITPFISPEDTRTNQHRFSVPPPTLRQPSFPFISNNAPFDRLGNGVQNTDGLKITFLPHDTFEASAQTGVFRGTTEPHGALRGVLRQHESPGRTDTSTGAFRTLAQVPDSERQPLFQGNPVSGSGESLRNSAGDIGISALTDQSGPQTFISTSKSSFDSTFTATPTSSLPSPTQQRLFTNSRSQTLNPSINQSPAPELLPPLAIQSSSTRTPSNFAPILIGQNPARSQISSSNINLHTVSRTAQDTHIPPQISPALELLPPLTVGSSGQGRAINTFIPPGQTNQISQQAPQPLISRFTPAAKIFPESSTNPAIFPALPVELLPPIEQGRSPIRTQTQASVLVVPSSRPTHDRNSNFDERVKVSVPFTDSRLTAGNTFSQTALPSGTTTLSESSDSRFGSPFQLTDFKIAKVQPISQQVTASRPPQPFPTQAIPSQSASIRTFQPNLDLQPPLAITTINVTPSTNTESSNKPSNETTQVTGKFGNGVSTLVSDTNQKTSSQTTPIIQASPEVSSQINLNLQPPSSIPGLLLSPSPSESSVQTTDEPLPTPLIKLTAGNEKALQENTRSTPAITSLPSQILKTDNIQVPKPVFTTSQTSLSGQSISNLPTILNSSLDATAQTQISTQPQVQTTTDSIQKTSTRVDTKVDSFPSPQPTSEGFVIFQTQRTMTTTSPSDDKPQTVTSVTHEDKNNSSPGFFGPTLHLDLVPPFEQTLSNAGTFSIGIPSSMLNRGLVQTTDTTPLTHNSKTNSNILFNVKADLTKQQSTSHTVDANQPLDKSSDNSSNPLSTASISIADTSEGPQSSHQISLSNSSTQSSVDRSSTDVTPSNSSFDPTQTTKSKDSSEPTADILPPFKEPSDRTTFKPFRSSLNGTQPDQTSSNQSILTISSRFNPTSAGKNLTFSATHGPGTVCPQLDIRHKGHRAPQFGGELLLSPGYYPTDDTTNKTVGRCDNNERIDGKKYNWWQILLNHGGEPSALNISTSPENVPSLRKPCIRPFETEGVPTYYNYTNTDSQTYYREEVAYHRFPGTAHTFLESRGLFVWKPKPATKANDNDTAAAAYLLRYARDDTGFWVDVESIDCVFDNNRESAQRLECRNIPQCTCSNDGQKTCSATTQLLAKNLKPRKT